MTRFKLIFRIVMIGLCTVVFATNALSTKAMVNRYVSPGGNDNGGLNVCTNAGNPLSLDQRGMGYGRPKDGDGNGTLICDIGAFELQTSPVPLPNPFIQGIEDIILAGGTAHFQVTLTNNENIDGIELNGRIGILGSDSQQSVSDSVLVTCDAPIDPNSISLTKTVFVTGANGSEEAVDSAELIGGQQAHIQLQLTNNRYSWNLYVCRPERSNKHSHNRRH